MDKFVSTYTKAQFEDAISRAVTGGDIDTILKGLLARASNENLLHNWYFANPINQRGQTEYVGKIYGIDRWSGTTAGTIVSVNDGYITVSATSDASPAGFLSQLAENIPDGAEVTFSAMYRGTGLIIRVGSGTGTGEVIAPGSVDWNVIKTTIPSIATGNRSNTFVQPLLRVSPGSSIDLMAAKLEYGPVQTLAHQDADGNWVLNDPPPDPAVELAKCQRFFRSLRGGQVGANANFGTGVAISSTTAYIYAPINYMRVAPSITSAGSFRLSVNGGKSVISVTSITSGGNYSAGLVRVTVTVASGLAQGDFVVLQSVDSSADIYFVSDL